MNSRNACSHRLKYDYGTCVVLAGCIPEGVFFLKHHSIHPIHNGVDLEMFRPMDGSCLCEKHRLGGKFVILGVASPWNTCKGLDDFYRLRTLLAPDYVIILVGLTPEQVKKLPKGIIGITRTESQQQLAEYYSMADTFVNLTYLYIPDCQS